MGAAQCRQRPARNNQPSTGTFSNQRSCVPQCGQRLPGQTRDSWRGRRHATTLRKLPTQAPNTAASHGSTPAAAGGSRESGSAIGLGGGTTEVERSAAARHAQPTAAPQGRTASKQLHRNELFIGEKHGWLKHHTTPAPVENHATGIGPTRTPFHVVEDHSAGLLKHLLAVDAIQSHTRGKRIARTRNQEGGTGLA